MHIAVDLDGTIDAAPSVYQSLMATMKAAGHTVTVLTSGFLPKGQSVDDIAAAKKTYLQNLGLGTAYTQLVVVPQKSGKNNVPDAKAAWLTDNHVDLYIDNVKDNVKAAIDAGVKLVLVPWATKS